MGKLNIEETTYEEFKNKILENIQNSEFENICDITHLTIEFEDGVIGQVSDSWIHPQKRVSLLVRGEKATAILDDTIAEGKLKIYDNKKNAQNDIEVFDYLTVRPYPESIFFQSLRS